MRSTPHAIVLLTLTCLLAPASAGAAVVDSRADGFRVEIPVTIAATRAAVFTALGKAGQWWSSDHTWSGDAKNLSLPLEAGGCFCERWDGGSVEHARVIFVRHGELLRLQGALGPMQPMPITGILTFVLEAAPVATPAAVGGATPAEPAPATQLTLTYATSGSSASALDKIGPLADGMLTATVGRLKAFVETGKPE
jgi:uncharacterized protein YndB with AHSA1/START domain